MGPSPGLSRGEEFHPAKSLCHVVRVSLGALAEEVGQQAKNLGKLVTGGGGEVDLGPPPP